MVDAQERNLNIYCVVAKILSPISSKKTINQNSVHT